MNGHRKVRSGLMEIESVEPLKYVQQLVADGADSRIIVEGHECSRGFAISFGLDAAGVHVPQNSCRSSAMPRGSRHDETGLILREG
jgi:hypothetical protein